MKILCGADPEFALVNYNDKFVSAIGKIGGTKKEPLPVKGSKYGLTVQEDNVSLEFGFSPVVVDKFAHTVYRVVDEVTKFVKSLPDQVLPYYSDSVLYDKEQLDCEKAQQFGCDPDHLAYERGDMRPPPEAKKMGNRRFFAGHLHIGYDKSIVTPAILPEWALVQGVEALCYLQYVTGGHDNQPHRRKFYGLPGLYRPKSYGVEWRTPSNWWLRHAECAEELLYCAQNIVSRPGAFADIYERIDWDDVKESIINQKQARKGLVPEMDRLRRELYDAPEEN